MASQVFYLDDRANRPGESLPFKAVKVFRDAGLGEVFKPGDRVGVKVHFGEHGNSLNLRPQYVRSIVDEIKRLGGEPVVVDCNTLNIAGMYTRACEADHRLTAARHGFTAETMGCPIWIGDGEYGFDDVKVAVPHGVYLTHSYMGRKLQDLDALIVVTHFKGHPMGVFGGAIKNVGIGMGSKRGKLCTHLFNHPQFGVKAWGINQEMAEKMAQGPKPTAMDAFVNDCPVGALSMNGEQKLDAEKCTGCGICSGGMLVGLFQPAPQVMLFLSATIPDACSGYLNAIGMDKVGFVSYAVDITPWCDCAAFHDRALVPNLGVFASKDPVAIDMACLEMVEGSPAVPGSKADELGIGHAGDEKFAKGSSMAGLAPWIQVNAAVYNGLGTSEYELVMSEPGPDAEFMMEPYKPGRGFAVVHKEALARGRWAPDYPFTYDEMKVAVPQLMAKPQGKVRGSSVPA